MNPIHPTCPDGQSTVIGSRQGDYQPLPARRLSDRYGSVITEWQLTEEERELIARGENLRITLMTFGAPLQPLQVAVTTPEGD
jgi:hypothetical protein